MPTGPPLIRQWRYEPTEWTRRLQVILLTLMIVGGLVSLAILPTVVLPTMQRSLDATMATMPANPNVGASSFRSTMSATYTTFLVFGGVLVVVFLAVILAGIVRLWRWVYWYLAVSFLITPLSVLQSVTYMLGSGPISIPGWTLLYSVPLALVEAALGIWMIVLYRRYGTWARRRIPA